MALIAITPSTVPIEERITLLERSQSTTQHYIQIQFDGVPIDTIDNTDAGADFQRAQPYKMPMTAQRVADLKRWFVERYLDFSSTSGRPSSTMRYDMERACACGHYPAREAA